MTNLPYLSKLYKQVSEKGKHKFTAYDLKGKYKSQFLRLLCDINILEREKRWKSSYFYRVTSFGEKILIQCKMYPEIIQIMAMFKTINDNKHNKKKKYYRPDHHIPYKIWRFAQHYFPDQNDIISQIKEMISTIIVNHYEKWNEKYHFYLIGLIFYFKTKDNYKLLASDASISLMTSSYLKVLNDYEISIDKYQLEKKDRNSIFSFEADRQTQTKDHFITIALPETLKTSEKNKAILPQWFQ